MNADKAKSEVGLTQAIVTKAIVLDQKTVVSIAEKTPEKKHHHHHHRQKAKKEEEKAKPEAVKEEPKATGHQHKHHHHQNHWEPENKNETITVKNKTESEKINILPPVEKETTNGTLKDKNSTNGQHDGQTEVEHKKEEGEDKKHSTTAPKDVIEKEKSEGKIELSPSHKDGDEDTLIEGQGMMHEDYVTEGDAIDMDI